MHHRGDDGDSTATISYPVRLATEAIEKIEPAHRAVQTAIEASEQETRGPLGRDAGR